MQPLRPGSEQWGQQTSARYRRSALPASKKEGNREDTGMTKGEGEVPVHPN
jgi:hypothetical protein